MNYHVFIVSESTFKHHIEYGFAGTGAGEKTSPFINNPETTNIHSTTERNLVGMIADISKIRINDKVIFYLQAHKNRQGMFFGVFKVNSVAFFDENNSKNYLKSDLLKGLSYRVNVEPDEVYQYGLTEHEYLDSTEHKSYPYQMCWSLIYRKLKGNRGCTMITEYEFNDFIDKIKWKNKNSILPIAPLTYDTTNHFITAGEKRTYQGSKDHLDITKRLLFKANRGNAFEVHLQAYILKNFDAPQLKNLLLPLPETDCWVGNEVSCGVGMQKIDILLIQSTSTDVYIKIVELKCIQAYSEIINNQIPWYIQRVSEYIAPNYINSNKQVHIIPCIIAQNTTNSDFHSCIPKFCARKVSRNLSISPIQFISFKIEGSDIKFSEV